jgi:hypothetical protein
MIHIFQKNICGFFINEPEYKKIIFLANDELKDYLGKIHMEFDYVDSIYVMDQKIIKLEEDINVCVRLLSDENKITILFEDFSLDKFENITMLTKYIKLLFKILMTDISNTKTKNKIKSLRNGLIKINNYNILSNSIFKWINLHVIYKYSDITYLLYISVKSDEDNKYFFKYYISKFVEK